MFHRDIVQRALDKKWAVWDFVEHPYVDDNGPVLSSNWVCIAVCDTYEEARAAAMSA